MTFLFGAADRLFVLFDLNYDTQLYIFRIGIWVVPVVLFFITRQICRNLRDGDLIDAEREVAEHEAQERARASQPVRAGRVT